VNAKSTFTVLLLVLVYFVLSYFLVGFKSDQVVLAVIFCTLFFASGVTRRFIVGFSIFIVYWIIFDYMKAFPNYNYNIVHIADLYHLEKRLFGIHTAQGILTPNEYWLAHHITTLDVISGIFYLCWVPVPLGFAAYLFFTNKRQFLYFSLNFFLVNLIGFVIYYLYPAAPPWYVQLHGFNFIKLTPGNTAGLGRFDAYFHAGVFKSIYAKSSNVFAAMPSLHSSYPLVVLYYGLKNRLGWVNVFFGLVMIGIWFAAVYASHHYLLDVLAGITCALTSIFLFRLLVTKSILVGNFLRKYESYIS
jgi:inositol phosphorylceramide synthase catalytic subunit